MVTRGYCDSVISGLNDLDKLTWLLMAVNRCRRKQYWSAMMSWSLVMHVFDNELEGRACTGSQYVKPEFLTTLPIVVVALSDTQYLGPCPFLHSHPNNTGTSTLRSSHLQTSGAPTELAHKSSMFLDSEPVTAIHLGCQIEFVGPDERSPPVFRSPKSVFIDDGHRSNRVFQPSERTYKQCQNQITEHQTLEARSGCSHPPIRPATEGELNPTKTIYPLYASIRRSSVGGSLERPHVKAIKLALSAHGLIRPQIFRREQIRKKSIQNNINQFIDAPVSSYLVLHVELGITHWVQKRNERHGHLVGRNNRR
ncbi:hypothetical protein AG1IA_00206 [Rhizoctonia solani AG-1 IA]|uniref:Uncharacterized protein n=1 Tax=Thanatephorus cucumeris (strain AG1-IA) TaxID=983506 RepID=L8X6C3_THACA|nr:hypothetical protein AG1IA_00206 [Rhizoctonia solani AG-1 IA]